MTFGWPLSNASASTVMPMGHVTVQSPESRIFSVAMRFFLRQAVLEIL